MPIVNEHITRCNEWYVGSHFEWAERPSIKPIYEKRCKYFVACINRAKARLGPNLRLLDAGCGDGYWLARLSKVGGLDLIGADYNPLRVERAKEVVPGARVFHGDLLSLKIQGPLDVILLNQVIEHVQDDIGLLRKMRTLLRPGGVLILGTPNEGSRLQRWSLGRKGTSLQTDHVHFYTEREIRNRIEEAGFVIDSVMREVFYAMTDSLYYSLTKRRVGFGLLEFMTRLWPSQCSDFYFECRLP